MIEPFGLRVMRSDVASFPAANRREQDLWLLPPSRPRRRSRRRTARHLSTRTGARAAGRLQPRLAAQRRCLGRAADLRRFDGYRAIAHDRRGHGRSSQPWNGNDMDTYADDLAELIEKLDLHEVDARRALDRRRRGRALHRPARHRARREGRAGRRGPAVDAEDRREPGRHCRSRCSTRSARALPSDRSQFYKDLSAAVLRRQPGRLEGVAGSPRCVLAAVACGRLEGRIRLHQGVLGDRLHRRPEADRRSDADHPRRRRPDRTHRRLRAPAPSKIIPDAELKVYPGAPHGLTARTRTVQRRPTGVHQELMPPSSRECRPPAEGRLAGRAGDNGDLQKARHGPCPCGRDQRRG